MTACIAITVLVINLVVTAVLTLVFRTPKVPDDADETQPAHYEADPGRSAAMAAASAPGTSSRS